MSISRTKFPYRSQIHWKSTGNRAKTPGWGQLLEHRITTRWFYDVSNSYSEYPRGCWMQQHSACDQCHRGWGPPTCVAHLLLTDSRGWSLTHRTLGARAAPDVVAAVAADHPPLASPEPRYLILIIGDIMTARAQSKMIAPSTDVQYASPHTRQLPRIPPPQ